MALIVVLILLFAGWMFWGWMVSEHRDIAWMKKWCSILFIITAMLISTGGGAVVTMVIIKRQHRSQFTRFATALESQLREGKSDEALRTLQAVINTPDEWSNDSTDPLKRMVSTTERIQEANSPPPTQEKHVAEKSNNSHRMLR